MAEQNWQTWPPLTGKNFGRKGLNFGRTEWLAPLWKWPSYAYGPHSLNSLYTCDPMWCRIQRCRLGSKVKNKKYYFQWWSLCSTPKYSSISRYKQTKYTCIDKIHVCKLLCVKIVMVLVSMTSCASKWKIKRNYVLIWWRLGDFCGIPLLCCTFIIYKN